MIVSKKNLDTEALSESEKKRREFIVFVRSLYDKGMTIKDIARITGKDPMTISKRLKGDPNILCRIVRQTMMSSYTEMVINLIQEGYTASAIVKRLKSLGCQSCSANIRAFVQNTACRYGLILAKYIRKASVLEKGTDSSSESPEMPEVKETKNAQDILKPETLPAFQQDCSKEAEMLKTHITRAGIFNYLWMNGPLSQEHREYLWIKYNDILPELEECIRLFREIFNRRNMPCLYLFIEKYKESKIKAIASFAKGLLKDIAAVENAVASQQSNGFVEGINSKLKTIKKSMYGRCGKLLLAAKLMYQKSA